MAGHRAERGSDLYGGGPGGERGIGREFSKGSHGGSSNNNSSHRWCQLCF